MQESAGKNQKLAKVISLVNMVGKIYQLYILHNVTNGVIFLLK